MSKAIIGNDCYAVIGNPVSHSLSPQIHTSFAAQTGEAVHYQAIEVAEDNFESTLLQLQQQGFKGVNITVPFKRQAWELSDSLSPRAEDAGAVNTIMFMPNGDIAGDNTDGHGLTQDLLQNLRVLIRQQKVLILGAGGAVRGVLGPIMTHGPQSITLANRSLEKAESLAEDFVRFGEIEVSAYADLGHETFDLVINGTAAGLAGKVPPVSASVLGANSVCYDMMYNIRNNTAFVDWALSSGAIAAYDGLGMLVEQAAESFLVWRGVQADTGELLKSLRQS